MRRSSVPDGTRARAALRLAIAALGAAMACGCRQDAAPDSTAEAPPGHRRMVRELGRVAEQQEALDRDERALWTSRLEALGPTGAPLERFRSHRRLGNLLLNEGRNAEAIQHLSAAEQLVPRLVGSISREEAAQAIVDVAVGHLRVAETSNCVHCESAESCLFPIRADGVHRDPVGSQNAIVCLERLLRSDPGHLGARWLLNLAHMTLGSWPDGVPPALRLPARSVESAVDFPRFENVARELGVDTYNMSGGAILDDFDGDGDVDLVTSDWGPRGQLLLFVNDGAGGLSERTKEAGLTGIVGGLNLLQADYDDDGDLDILVLRGAWLGDLGRQPNSLLRNDGAARFVDVAYDAGLAGRGLDFPTQTASWADYDSDGDLDLYVGNEELPCQLFRNEGDGTFTDVAKSAGVENGDFTKGVIWGDYDGDLDPDLYVSNYASPNRLYRNDGGGKFTDVATELGVERPLRSFPTWFWDFDNDGNLDLWVGSSWWKLRHLAASWWGVPDEAELACLYRGTGDGRFEEVAPARGLTTLTLPMGCNFGDLDNDGWLDFYLGTGYPEFEGLMPNALYHNLAGERFVEVSGPARMGHLQKGHGIAFADIDGDGDQDVFSQMGGAFPADAFRNALYRNPGFGHGWVKIRLVGTRTNRFGVGAAMRLEIVDGDRPRTIWRHVNSGGSFGANPLRLEIGLGRASRIEVLEVLWPVSRTRQRFSDLEANRTWTITEGGEARDSTGATVSTESSAL